VPAPLLTASDLAIIAREHVAGKSDAVIGAMLDPPVERSTVRKARGRRAMQPLIAKERRLKLDREKSARYRERKAAAAEAERVEGGDGPPQPATSLELQAAADQTSQPEIVDRQAAAAAAACYVERLEAAYEHAFAAIETLVTAIERVQQLRGQEHVWEHANTLAVAPKRPEPWHVRAAFDDKLGQLQKRLNRAHNSSW
jgi:hypothetical protein